MISKITERIARESGLFLSRIDLYEIRNITAIIETYFESQSDNIDHRWSEEM